jgi:DNA-binding response OmpR family regulator
MKILIADDDAMFRTMLQTMAGKWGHEAIIARNGVDAWEELRAPDGPRVAILDWVMPEVDGLEVCRRVRSGSLPNYVYVILLTAKQNSSDLLAGLEAGADEFLTKPASLDELRLRIGAASRIMSLEMGQQASELHLTQLRRLFGELFRAQDEERARVARQLHEGIAQTISGVAISLNCWRNSEVDVPRWRADLSEIVSAAQGCMRDIQALSYKLHPQLLDEIGLVTALHAFAERPNQHPGIDVDVSAPAGLGRLRRELEMTVFRIVQEGVAKLHHNFGCRRAMVCLELGAGNVQLLIRGEGGQPQACGSQGAIDMELLALTERAEQHGGRLDVRPSDGGALMTVVLPVDRESQQASA